MGKLGNLEPERVFYYFEEVSAIPRGSGNRKGIADYIENFANKHSLKCVRDEADNVIIFKEASGGCEEKEAVIIQGHLDMVCQKEPDCKIDFEKDGINLMVDGGYVTAKGTTLGADNGIAVAMMLAILESDTYCHPPIEAVFTADEEVGMLGAMDLDTECLKGRRMINLDSEEQDLLTVSCAGGSDFKFRIDTQYKEVSGEKITLQLSGFRGGHSGMEIDKGGVNADILLGRILNKSLEFGEFDIAFIEGGDKCNAIPRAAKAEIITTVPDFKEKLGAYLDEIKKEISSRESGFEVSVISDGEGSYTVFDDKTKEKLINLLMTVPNGIMSMSREVENLVETSLNLGILKTEQDCVLLHFALRSNKKSALKHLEEKLGVIAKLTACEAETSGHYPPWEFKEHSFMQKLYLDLFREKFGYDAKVTAIHAGLECGMFADKIDGLDCISFGPEMHDVHTVDEKLSIPSTKSVFELLLSILEKM